MTHYKKNQVPHPQIHKDQYLLQNAMLHFTVPAHSFRDYYLLFYKCLEGTVMTLSQSSALLWKEHEIWSPETW